MAPAQARNPTFVLVARDSDVRESLVQFLRLSAPQVRIVPVETVVDGLFRVRYERVAGIILDENPARDIDIDRLAQQARAIDPRLGLILIANDLADGEADLYDGVAVRVGRPPEFDRLLDAIDMFVPGALQGATMQRLQAQNTTRDAIRNEDRKVGRRTPR